MPNYKSVHRDANHKEILKALRDAGLRVFDTAALGDGFPDLVVVRKDGTVRLVEVKSEITSGADKIKNEVIVMISLVSQSYRIVDTVDKAIIAVMEEMTK